MIIENCYAHFGLDVETYIQQEPEDPKERCIPPVDTHRAHIVHADDDPVPNRKRKRCNPYNGKESTPIALRKGRRNQ